MTGSLHLFGPGPQVAGISPCERVKASLADHPVGVSFNKIFNKLGAITESPTLPTVVTEENYRAIVHPLPVSALLYVGAATAQPHPPTASIPSVSWPRPT